MKLRWQKAIFPSRATGSLTFKLSSNFWFIKLGHIQVHAWALQRGFRDTHTVIVLLEGKAPPLISSLSQTWSSLGLAPSVSPSTMTSFPAPGGENHLHDTKLPPPCFAVEMVFSGWRILVQRCALFPGQKWSALVWDQIRSDQEITFTFPILFAAAPTCLMANSSQGFRWLAALPALWSVQTWDVLNFAKK